MRLHPFLTGPRARRSRRAAWLLGVALLAGCELKDAKFFEPNRLDLSAIYGTVFGAVTVNGQGVGGITVSAGGRSTVTSSDGSYTLTELLPGPNLVSISGVSAPASCPQVTATATVTAGASVRQDFACTAPTTGSVSGVVTVNGIVTPGVGITVGTRTATTSAAGTYRIDDLAPGSTTVGVTAPSGATCSPSSRQVTIVVGTVATADFTCTRPLFGSLGGMVTVNGIPTAGFTVAVGNRFATTGGNGMYRIDELSPGTLQATLMEVPPLVTCSPSSQTVVITADQVTTANFTCTQPTTGSVAGTVTINGTPASGISVVSGLASTTTAGDGSYRLDGLLPGTVIVALTNLLPGVTCSPSTSVSVVVAIAATTTANFVCTQPPPDFQLGVLSSYRHFVSTSEVCAVVVTNPAQPNMPYSGTLTGPFVLSGQGTMSGMLNSSGSATLRFGIGAYGMYSGSVTVLNKTTPFSINVTASAGACPP